MYNQELKEGFLKEHELKWAPSYLKSARLAFETTAEFEEKYGTDLCALKIDALCDMFDEVSGLRTGSARARMAVFRAYVRWCIEKDVPGACEDLLFFDGTEGTAKVARYTVASPQHLWEYLDSIFFKNTSENTVAAVYAGYFWLAYSGMLEEDALELKASEIDFDERIIKKDGRKYPIYQEEIDTLYKCATQDSFEYPHHSAKAPIKRLRTEGSGILRGFRPTQVRSRRAKIIAYIRKAQERNPEAGLGLDLSYKRVWLSGVFYTMYQQELEGIPVDFMPVALNFMSDRQYKEAKTKAERRHTQSAIARQYLLDYERWKDVYYKGEQQEEETN